MNAEKQIIGSLLLDSSRIDEMHLINSEMFVDSILGKIFSIYEHADGKEVNQLVIIPQIKSDMLSEKDAVNLLANLVAERDSGISDRCCVNAIYDEYRKRKFEEAMSHTRVSSQNIDKTLEEYQELIDGLQRNDSENEPKSLSQLTELQSEYFVEKNENGFTFGFTKIDKAIGGLDEGDLIIIAARPAVGKSAYTLQAIRKFGREGKRVGYFNLEMAEKQIYERAVASASGIDMTRIRLATNFLNDEKEKFIYGNELLRAEKNVFIISDKHTINEIRNVQKKAKYDIIVIDYLQLIQSNSKRNSRVAEVGDISRGLKAIAKDFHIPVIALSQLNRVSEMNKDKEPSMSELRESGDIEQDASVIIMLWNPNVNDPCEKKIKVEKSRNGYTDRETLYFDGKHMTFSTLDIGRDFEDVEDQEELPWN